MRTFPVSSNPASTLSPRRRCSIQTDVSARITAFLGGAVVAYELSVRLAFKQHRLESRRKEFASFVAIGVVGLAVNAAVIFVMVRYAGLHYLIAKCVAAGCTFFCNFVARRQILFVRYVSAS